MMKDLYGNEIKTGDRIIVTVSKGSLYLTIAEILGISEDGRLYISYLSTPKEKWIDTTKEPVMYYFAPPRQLESGVGLFRDNAGNVVNPEDHVAWKDGFNINLGIIKEVESDLWATLTTGTRVRNTQIIKLSI